MARGSLCFYVQIPGGGIRSEVSREGSGNTLFLNMEYSARTWNIELKKEDFLKALYTVTADPNFAKEK